MAGRKYLQPVNFEGVSIIYRHFSGKRDQFHKEGERDFHVIIDDVDYARFLADEGWNVKFPKHNPDINPEEDNRRPILKVKVNMNSDRPPKVNLISTDRNGDPTRELIDESTIGELDFVRFSEIDLVITSWEYEEGKFSAYLQQFYGTIDPVGFEAKYGF